MPPAHRTRNVIGLLGAFVVTSMAGGVLAAGLAMPAVGASGMLTKNSVTFFDSLPGELSVPPLSEQTTLLAADGSLITTFYDENRVLVPLDKISLYLQHAIVAIEDSRFFEHGGVDPKGLARAAIVNQVAHRTAQGASTLTQQYVKNVLLESANARGDLKGEKEATELSAGRKIQEIRYAVSLEKKYKKPEILNRYLNIAWFGGKINGVEAAARYYFHTSAAKLTLPQAATLAGMVQSPPKYSPRYRPKEALARRNIVLHRMLQLGDIDRRTHDQAVRTKLGEKINPSANGCANAAPLNAYYCEYVRLQIIGNKDFGELGKTAKAREKALLRGGLTIRTALKPKIIKAAWKSLSSTIPPKDKSKVVTAAVTVEPGTGLVFSMMQNQKYVPTKGKRGETSVNYSVDQMWGGGGGFQTGSTFKPFTLARWLEEGHSLNASVSSSTGTAPFAAFKSCIPLDKSQSYPYSNSEGSGKGNMTVFDGTARSVNGVFISMEKQLNLCDIRKSAESLGVHLGASRLDWCSAEKNDTTTRLPACAPSLTLGVADISPMTMAAAYAGFAAGGKFCKPIVVTSITNRSGRTFKVPSAGCKQTMDKNVANTVNYGLSRALKPGGTAASVGPLPGGRPASGKTGTTNNSLNTWFIGYTPQVATAVWVGDPLTYKVGEDSKGNPIRSQKTLNGRKIKGQYYGKVFGSTLAGPMWKKIMQVAVKGTEIKQFDPPDSRLTMSPRTQVPDVDGQSVDAAKSTLEGAGFSWRVDSSPVPSDAKPGAVASTSPGGGSSASTGTEVTIRISAGGGDEAESEAEEDDENR
jgi:membrane peptidoglycan carboxypeptidase